MEILVCEVDAVLLVLSLSFARRCQNPRTLAELVILPTLLVIPLTLNDVETLAIVAVAVPLLFKYRVTVTGNHNTLKMYGRRRITKPIVTG